MRYLKNQNLPVTLANANTAWARILETLDALDSEPAPAGYKITDKEVAELGKIIESWSSSEMRENMKDPEMAEAVEAVLAAKAKQEKARAKKAKVQPKPQQPPKPPVAEDVAAIDKMSSEDMKRALAKGQGPAIEKILSRPR